MTYAQLNARVGELVKARMQKGIEQGDALEVVIAVSQMAIDASNRILELVEAGLTYPIWKEFLVEINHPDNGLAIIENEEGDLAQIIKEFEAMDLSEDYERELAAGSFNPENIKLGIIELTYRLEKVKADVVADAEMVAEIDSLRKLADELESSEK